ncbi:MAG: hypothetical protein ACK518_00135 [bacterium]|jgi:hypothetical protein
MQSLSESPFIKTYKNTLPASVFLTLGSSPITLIPPQKNKLIIFQGLQFINQSGALSFILQLVVYTPWYGSFFNFISDYNLTFSNDLVLYYMYPKLNNVADNGLYRIQDPASNQTLLLSGIDDPLAILFNDFSYTLYYSTIDY